MADVLARDRMVHIPRLVRWQRLLVGAKRGLESWVCLLGSPAVWKACSKDGVEKEDDEICRQCQLNIKYRASYAAPRKAQAPASTLPDRESVEASPLLQASPQKPPLHISFFSPSPACQYPSYRYCVYSIAFPCAYLRSSGKGFFRFVPRSILTLAFSPSGNQEKQRQHTPAFLPHRIETVLGVRPIHRFIAPPYRLNT